MSQGPTTSFKSLTKEELEKAAREREIQARRAAIQLAHLLSKDLDVQINPKKLADLIGDKWARISTLAHTVHNPRRRQ